MQLHLSIKTNLSVIVIYCPSGLKNTFLKKWACFAVFSLPSSQSFLVLLCDNLPSNKLQSSCLLSLLHSFSLIFNSCPPTQQGWKCPGPGLQLPLSSYRYQCYPSPNLRLSFGILQHHPSCCA